MELKANLTVTISKQGGRYVAYAPALDISTSGKNEAEAKRRFGELVPLFFEELEEAGTTAAVLTELGWQRETSKSAHAFHGFRPPVVKSEEMQVSIPVIA